MDTKDKVETIFKKSFLFNVISNESNNIKSKRILNITILRKKYYAFYVFSESVKNKSLNIAKNAFQIFAKMLKLINNNLSKIVNVITDIYSLKQDT